MNVVRRSLLFAALSTVFITPLAFGAKRMANDGSGAYATGHYRDLFAEQLGHNQKESRTKVDAAFDQFFHGDKNTQALYYEVGSNANGPLAYITDVANKDARTEGMSYGMMIAVQMNHKHEFDAIWNWANTYMLITDPANPSAGYFSWSMYTDGTPRSDSPAPDGEEYFVMSLYFAANRWGNGTGIYNYKAQADRILSLMRHHPVQTGTPPFRLKPGEPPFVPPVRAGSPPRKNVSRTVGPMVNEQAKMILFVPGGDRNSFTDPSYHLPAFYELWSRWGPIEDRLFWAEATTVSRAFFQKATNPTTGLSSDYANFDGTPRESFNPMSATFSYDSWRTASNWSVDYSWWHKEPQEPVLSDRIQKFLLSQGVNTLADRYTLDGKPLSTRRSTGMVATTATASLAATPGEKSKVFLAELWKAPVPSGEQRYYDGMLYMMSLLHCSGNFRIWGPK
ncbi:glycosyl hydrolase family 8 [Granulicella arctica]|uniref:cellulase n=1 Tax=Granulicella arctica TaxID=940613 RepID=A0A7Y9PJM5_9BACT|nr:glycosyl hydrolase family 8 [Granulicella arctica]NYF81125.1 oligosaccharide reducing-end xylanase [Granulicella arctica]